MEIRRVEAKSKDEEHVKEVIRSIWSEFQWFLSPFERIPVAMQEGSQLGALVEEPAYR